MRRALKIIFGNENNCRVCHVRMVVKERCIKKNQNPKEINVAETVGSSSTFMFV